MLSRFDPARVLLVSSLYFLTACASVENDTFDVAPQDWLTRSTQAGVVRAIGFDAEEEISRYRAPTFPDRMVLDTQIRASGKGAMRVIIPGESPANTSGTWRVNFSEDPFATQFGENQTFYVQWRQRFDAFYLQHEFRGASGFKQIIIGEGDRPGEKEARSCTSLEIVVNNGWFRGYPQMYHSCGLYWPYEPYRFVDYVEDEWMTFQVGITLGPLGVAYDSATGKEAYGYTNSSIEMWVAREGERSKLTHRESDLVLRVDQSQYPIPRYGKVWFLTYMTGKDPREKHSETYTWYDELIISRSRIADPK